METVTGIRNVGQIVDHKGRLMVVVSIEETQAWIAPIENTVYDEGIQWR